MDFPQVLAKADSFEALFKILPQIFSFTGAVNQVFEEQGELAHGLVPVCEGQQLLKKRLSAVLASFIRSTTLRLKVFCFEQGSHRTLLTLLPFKETQAIDDLRGSQMLNLFQRARFLQGLGFFWRWQFSSEAVLVAFKVAPLPKVVGVIGLAPLLLLEL